MFEGSHQKSFPTQQMTVAKPSWCLGAVPQALGLSAAIINGWHHCTRQEPEAFCLGWLLELFMRTEFSALGGSSHVVVKIPKYTISKAGVEGQFSSCLTGDLRQLVALSGLSFLNCKMGTIKGMSFLGLLNGNPLQCSCPENAMDTRAW